MAITQSRVIAILSAARRFYNYSSAIKREAKAIVSQIRPDATREELIEALQAIQFLLDQQFASEDDIALLAAEERHFELSFKKNQRLAEYARRKRAGLAGLSFTGHKAGRTGPDIDDEAKAAIYAHAEHAIAISHTNPNQRSELEGKRRSTAPDKLHSSRPIDFYTTAKPDRFIAPLSDAQLGLSPLAEAKFKANELKRKHHMKIDYEDPTDDSQPLTPDDARAFGFSTPADDEELF